MDMYKILRENMLMEMARVGFINGKYEIYIHTDDPGNIPHFHIWDKETRGQNFHTCIKIITPEYFHHNGKENILNNKMKKELIEFLQLPSRNKRYSTNWEYLVSMWNDNNSNINIPENISMPNYMKL